MILRILCAGFISLLLLISACELEPCKDFRCVNGEAQEDFNECVCLCERGWYGEDCTDEDKCVTRNVQCVKGQGTCDPAIGVCECMNGYEGDSCHILSREKFLQDDDTSTWNARDTCGLMSPVVYVVELVPNVDKKDLEIFNPHDIDDTRFIQVTVKLMEFYQKRPVETFNSGQIEIQDLQGILSADGNTLRVTYRYSEGLPLNCSGTWIRQ